MLMMMTMMMMAMMMVMMIKKMMMTIRIWNAWWKRSAELGGSSVQQERRKQENWFKQNLPQINTSSSVDHMNHHLYSFQSFSSKDSFSFDHMCHVIIISQSTAVRWSGDSGAGTDCATANPHVTNNSECWPGRLCVKFQAFQTIVSQHGAQEWQK